MWINKNKNKKNSIELSRLKLKIMKTIEAVAHKDIKGKELYYLVVKSDIKEVYVNVGVKTYKAVRDIEIPSNKDQLKLEIDETEPKGNFASMTHEKGDGDKEPPKKPQTIKPAGHK